MRWETRLVRLERRHLANPGLFQRWMDMLTGRYAAAVAYPDDGTEDRARRALAPDGHASLRETAGRYARTGSPATLSDLFRLVRAEEGSDAQA
jgi:hypothetical protein